MRFIEFIVVRAKGDYCSLYYVPDFLGFYFVAKVQGYAIIPFD